MLLLTIVRLACAEGWTMDELFRAIHKTPEYRAFAKEKR